MRRGRQQNIAIESSRSNHLTLRVSEPQPDPRTYVCPSWSRLPRSITSRKGRNVVGVAKS